MITEDQWDIFAVNINPFSDFFAKVVYVDDFDDTGETGELEACCYRITYTEEDMLGPDILNGYYCLDPEDLIEVQIGERQPIGDINGISESKIPVS